MNPTLADLNRRLENLLKIGEVAEVQAGLVRVQIGALCTDWLPYCTLASGAVSAELWPSVGEKCLVLSPSGQLANGMVLCGLRTHAWPAPDADPEETVLHFGDGARASYHHGRRHFDFSGAKTMTFSASDKILFQTALAVFTGQAIIQQATLINGPLTYTAGMTGSGGDGGGSTRISGSFRMSGSFTQTNGQLSSNGVVLDGHQHRDSLGGTTGAPLK